MNDKWTRSTRRKPAPVPLCPPQTPHAARMRTQAAAVGSQRLTAWATARLKLYLRKTWMWLEAMRTKVFRVFLRSLQENAGVVISTNGTTQIYVRIITYTPFMNTTSSHSSVHQTSEMSSVLLKNTRIEQRTCCVIIPVVHFIALMTRFLSEMWGLPFWN
jgi:hypothetical protein